MTLSFVDQVKSFRVIPVIAVQSVEEAVGLGKVLLEADLPVAEVTFRSKAAKEALSAMKKAYPELCVGAGTILNATQAVEAQEAGADFIVSPGFNLNTVCKAKELNLPIIPGVNNPTAIEMALEEGLTALKFFPAKASGGPEMIKALLAPYQDIVLMSTGGINLDNVMDYLSIDRVIACGLSWMVEPALLKAGDWAEVKRRIEQVKQKTML